MLSINLNGKTALVTGGAKGVGEGICRILSQAGASLLINFNTNREKAEQLKERITASGGIADIYQADASDAEQVAAMVSYMKQKHSSIDILVNNAGITTAGNLEELSFSEIEKVIKVNTIGAMICAKAAIPHMKAAGNGRIINIASTSMFTGGGGGPHYAASKAALMGLTRNLAKVYGKDGITTNALAISLIDTELFRERYQDSRDRETAISKVPVGRAGTPEDVGYAVAFLASEFGSYINGEIISIDGGRTFA